MAKCFIKDIQPFLKKDWVAMDKNGTWNWFARKPDRSIRFWFPLNKSWTPLKAFNIAPADDWKNSLMEV